MKFSLIWLHDGNLYHNSLYDAMIGTYYRFALWPKPYECALNHYHLHFFNCQKEPLEWSFNDQIMHKLPNQNFNLP